MKIPQVNMFVLTGSSDMGGIKVMSLKGWVVKARIRGGSSLFERRDCIKEITTSNLAHF